MVPLLVGVLLDHVLGEPRTWHPLVGFGRYAERLERWLNREAPPFRRRVAGVVAWALAVLPFVALFVVLFVVLSALLSTARLPSLATGWVLDALALYFALGARSLAEHAGVVGKRLEAKQLPEARMAVSLIVSRDTTALDATDVSVAAVESVLENGNDAIFGALFWFAILGGPGALLFRFANTLDAMWGYRTPRFSAFGWAAARIDDALSFLPARLTALSYAVVGRTRQALSCWRQQAPLWDSPNAGPVMAAGAGALGLRLGGPAVYHGAREERPMLGGGVRPGPKDIRRALHLVHVSYGLWVAAIATAFCLRWALGILHG